MHQKSNIRITRVANYVVNLEYVYVLFDNSNNQKVIWKLIQDYSSVCR